MLNSIIKLNLYYTTLYQVSFFGKYANDKNDEI